ncbi:acyl carrier protein [Curvivirga aplysinae]|uniref:acyl carrier protein n=1 Tax=Curvivirga aplysinae TaxID=2529852 RepID=UPI0012BC6386|nr:acyl carrier protein [Curvivirga aplysinae]MTI10396.1 acyl carrier protein [Curvivirga aplysinae]
MSSAVNYEDRIRKLLCDEFGLEENLDVNEKIFSSGFLDSMDVLTLIVLMEKEFAIKVPVFEASLDMFDSITEINKLIAKYQ